MSDQTLARVVESIARTTRYPIDLLTADADLENELGIDSVKRLEIVVALGDAFGLPLDRETRDPSIRTVQDVADWIDGFIVREPSQESTATILERRTTPPAKEDPVPIVHAAEPQTVPPPRFIKASQGDLGAAAKPLAGKVAFISGSGRGVGRTIARVLASRGATVIVNSFHSREQGEQTTTEIRAEGGAASHLWGSVANPRHVDEMFAQIEEHFGQLDILICNASDGRIGPFMDLTHDDWDRAFRTNVTGHHQCAVKAAPLMRSGGGGSIITMSAVGAHGYIEGLGSQGVVKAAVESLTRYLACELGPFGIRVNCVAGGPIYGDLLSKFPNSRSTQAHWESMTPDGELCSPLDLANSIAFLVSDEARGINGSVWMVDHGFSATSDGRPVRIAARDAMTEKFQATIGK